MPTRRSFLQIHLSTAIVLMFTAGGLMWANTQERTPNGSPPVIDPHQKVHFTGTLEMKVEFYKPRYAVLYGWPFTLVGKLYTRIGIKSHEQPDISFWMPIANVLIALGILSTVWFICECLIRRSASRKQSP